MKFVVICCQERNETTKYSLKDNYKPKIISEIDSEAALMKSINICSQYRGFRAWFSIKISDSLEKTQRLQFRILYYS